MPCRPIQDCLQASLLWKLCNRVPYLEVIQMLRVQRKLNILILPGCLFMSCSLV